MYVTQNLMIAATPWAMVAVTEREVVRFCMRGESWLAVLEVEQEREPKWCSSVASRWPNPIAARSRLTNRG